MPQPRNNATVFRFRIIAMYVALLFLIGCGSIETTLPPEVETLDKVVIAEVQSVEAFADVPEDVPPDLPKETAVIVEPAIAVEEVAIETTETEDIAEDIVIDPVEVVEAVGAAPMPEQAAAATKSATPSTAPHQSAENQQEATPAQVQVTLKVESPNGVLKYLVDLSEEKTVEDLMKKARKSAGFQYRATGFGSMGRYVEEIDGVKEDTKNNLFWIYYLNDKKAYVGISTQKVEEGDEVTWKYESSYNN